MDSDKKVNYKSFLLPAVFVVLLILTVIFHKQAYSQDKEALGEEVFVDVLEVRSEERRVGKECGSRWWRGG